MTSVSLRSRLHGCPNPGARPDPHQDHSISRTLRAHIDPEDDQPYLDLATLYRNLVKERALGRRRAVDAGHHRLARQRR